MRALIISDTHGLLRPEVLPLARAADVILHAGDVGRAEVLDGLRTVSPAPIHAVRGNVDRSPPLSSLPETVLVELGGVSVYVLHDLTALECSPAAAGIGVVISGHTHAPRLEERDGVIFLNPGAVGPRRFRLPVACAWLHVADGAVRVEPVVLEP